jgi:tetratricopeptide (TPR) repeat protein
MNGRYFMNLRTSIGNIFRRSHGLVTSNNPNHRFVAVQNVRVKQPQAVRIYPSEKITITIKSNNTIDDLSRLNLMDYSQSRKIRYMQLKKHLDNGKQSFNKCRTQESMSSFDIIIAFMANFKKADINRQERYLIAQALTYKARILSIGTVEQTDLAIDCLKKALELLPNLVEAKEFYNALNAERSVRSNNVIDGPTRT